MKRRNFFKAVAAVSMGGIAGYSCSSTGNVSTEYENIDTIGNLNLSKLRDRYRSALFDQFLPSMDKYVIDHKYGGFMCTVDIRTGERLSDRKRAWYEGRGMWVYSFLYNNIDQDPAYLEVARKSKDFIMKHQPSDGEFWISSFSREGKPLSESGDIYGSLFIAEGLAEYAKASGETEFSEIAKEIIGNCLDRYDQPDYDYQVGYLSEDAHNVPGPRVLGHWMVFLRSATQILKDDSDPQIEQLADRCVNAIMNHHLNSDYRLLNELLRHDLTLPDNEFAQFSYLGHSIETLWMVLHEAVRRRDWDLFSEAGDLFKRHVRVASDGVYGGCFRSLDQVDNYRFELDKVLWLQEEVLIGSLILIEHTGDPWARRIFAENEAYVQEKFVRPDFKFWIPNGNRRVTEYNTSRAEHYHLPRYLMLNLLAVERIMERGGRTSQLFADYTGS